MVDHYQFHHGLNFLAREIILSKRLAMVATADIELHFERKQKKLICTRTTDEPLNLKAILNTPIHIPYIQIEEDTKTKILFTTNGCVHKENTLTFVLGRQRAHMTDEGLLKIEEQSGNSIHK